MKIDLELRKTAHHISKAKLSAARKGKSATWNKGKPKSEETKKKMSDAFKGKHWKLADGKRVWY